MKKPYYEDVASGITIYNADCRDIIPQLPEVPVIITDPVWPDNKVFKNINPEKLFSQTMKIIKCKRLVVQLGCDSDPRFLRSIPKNLKYVRSIVLEYARPSYKGRILYTGDIAYIFGSIPAYERKKLIPGRYVSSKVDNHFIRQASKNEKDKSTHPTPRRLQHVVYLVDLFGEEIIVDPFMGSGTTLVAAKHLGYNAIGIEISKEYCDIAVNRLRQGVIRYERM